jgi:hypothetical protein
MDELGLSSCGRFDIYVYASLHMEPEVCIAHGMTSLWVSVGHIWRRRDGGVGSLVCWLAVCRR